MKYKHKITGEIIDSVIYDDLSYIEQEDYSYYSESSLVDDIIDIGISGIILGNVGGDIDIDSDNITRHIDFGGGSFGGAGAGDDW